MTEWIVTSSAMILIIIALRGLLKGKFSLKLQYGLWALVLIRLLFPFSIVDSAISISNLLSAPVIQEADEAVADYETAYQSAVQRHESSGTEYTDTEIRQQVQQELYDRTYTKLEQEYAQSAAPVPEMQIQTEAQQQVEVISLTAVITEALPYLWIIGMMVVAVVLIGSNIHFGWKLYQSRILLDISGVPLKVYLTDYVATPCLFGTVKPDIYLTGEVMTDSKMRHHVIAHEMSHYRQGDYIWSVLRCVCLVLHWYNPLVWVAAILSKQDAELACDEATIKALGEAERVAYGRTLIGMTCVRRDPGSLMLTATTMLGTKKTLKERIALIAKKPKTALYTLIACILVVSLAVGCTFTGAPARTEEEMLLDRCRKAVEYIQNLDHFEITEHTEITGETDPDTLGLSHEEARYIHSGDDWFHSLIGPDWTWQFINKDGMQFRKDITSAIPKEDIPYPDWTRGNFSNDFYANHSWIMDLEWDDDKLVIDRNSVRTEYSILSVETEANGIYQQISVHTEVVNGPEAIDSVVFTFCFDNNSSEAVCIIRTVSEGEFTNTNTLSIYPGTEEMSAIIDDIYYGEIVTTVPTPEDPTETPTTEPTEIPTEPPTEPLTEPTTEPSHPLSLEEQFQQMLTSENGYWYWRAMGCVFEKPEELSLYYLFYNGLPHDERQDRDTYTDTEVEFLQGIARNSSWQDETAWVNAHKMPRQYISDVLANYFGLTLEDVTIPEEWSYFEETDSYYYIRSDSYGVNRYSVTEVNSGENGVIYVYWTTDYIRDTRAEEISFINQPQMVMVLEEKTDGGYLIHMNMPVAELLSPTDPAEGTTEQDIIGILFSTEIQEAEVSLGVDNGFWFGVSADLEQHLRDMLNRYEWTRAEDDSFEKNYAVINISGGVVRGGDYKYYSHWLKIRAIEDGKFLISWEGEANPREYYMLTPKDPEANSYSDILEFIREHFSGYPLPGRR